MHELFVSCPRGFEPILQKELLSLGIASASPTFLGVFVPKTMENVFLVNYLSRVATRVLWPIAQFACRGKEDLYRESKRVIWSQFLHCNKTFAIDANVEHPGLKNSLFASYVVKDAICDFFKEKTGERPSIDTRFPDVQLNLFIQKGRAHLYLDTSGAPLHKRGWRMDQTEASLHESLAAALLLFTNYNPEDHIFCDPFCGSGTFLVEAALLATKTPPGFFRKKWGFFHLPQFDKERFLRWKEQKDAFRIPLLPGKIFGSDKSRETTEICKKHLKKALGEWASAVEVCYDEIAFYTPKEKFNFVLSNPPYGKRLETSLKIFQDFHRFLKEKGDPQPKAYVLAPEETLLQQASFQMEERLHFKTGGLPVKLFALS